MELIQTIRNEIERLKEEAYNSILPDEPKYRTHYKVGKKELCEELLSFLDTLREPKFDLDRLREVAVPLSEEEKEAHRKMMDERRKKYEEMGILQEPEVKPDEPEKAAIKYCPDDAYPFGPMAINLEVRKAFIAGYKYHEEHTPLPEDSVLFNKGVEEGKRLIMEEAVEGEICHDRAGVDYLDYDIARLDKYIFSRFKVGDKVRIIILKEEEL